MPLQWPCPAIATMASGNPLGTEDDVQVSHILWCVPHCLTNVTIQTHRTSGHPADSTYDKDDDHLPKRTLLSDDEAAFDLIR
jgi:hypothetical protein